MSERLSDVDKECLSNVYKLWITCNDCSWNMFMITGAINFERNLERMRYEWIAPHERNNGHTVSIVKEILPDTSKS